MSDDDPLITPLLALSYVRELSTDVRGGAVTADGDALLAGDVVDAGSLATIASAAARGPLAIRAGDGLLVAARAGDYTLSAVAGTFALVPILLHDVMAAVDALARSQDADWRRSRREDAPPGDPEHLGRVSAEIDQARTRAYGEPELAAARALIASFPAHT